MNASTRARPCSLARYFAASARRSSCCASIPSSGATATPTLQVNDTPRTDADRRVAGGRDALGKHHRELAARQVGKQHRQLVAPVPSEGVLDAEAVANALRDRAQHLVAGRVAEGIVDQLELVDVDEAHADSGVVDTCVQQRLLEAVEEHRPRWKTRQGIVLESPACGLLRHPQLGQVDRDPLRRTVEPSAVCWGREAVRSQRTVPFPSTMRPSHCDGVFVAIPCDLERSNDARSSGWIMRRSSAGSSPSASGSMPAASRIPSPM